MIVSPKFNGFALAFNVSTLVKSYPGLNTENEVESQNMLEAHRRYFDNQAVA